jgi:mRNA-degrading endonuclease RelE of RelBE toxin-antitoxin system
MTPGFTVLTTAHFDRLAKSLRKQHQEFTARYEEGILILREDPYNRTRRYPIKKLTNIPPGEGQYRLRLGRFRFRYDIEGQEVILSRCGLRREDTYE